MDGIVVRLWAEEIKTAPLLEKGVALTAVGGFGRKLLFPCSDVDVLVCVEKSVREKAAQPIRRLSQHLWDCGLQVALSTRTLRECERFEPTNPEFGISLLDLRSLGGDAELFAKLRDKCVGKLRQRDAKSIAAELARLTRDRHAKYGNTLFHLEPNIKDSPGGLRDTNVCEWLHSLRGKLVDPVRLKSEDPLRGRSAAPQSGDFHEALSFLASVRCFLHYRDHRDTNVLDWQAQDAAAQQGVGLGKSPTASREVDAAYWMRAYFRHARVIERALLREAEGMGQRGDLRIGTAPAVKRAKVQANAGFSLNGGQLELDASLASGEDPATQPEVVLGAFCTMAATGASLTAESEERIAEAIPSLSANLEEGPGLWRRLSAILTGERAGAALRSMHALGVLELILPEFHGIDALVIRDAYHRYTVDEHTFVLIDILHGLELPQPDDAPDWKKKFSSMIRELQNPALLYLAAILHDTGKGRSGGSHAAESARMARGVLRRLEMDSYDAELVLRLIETHLDMSAALRRDIFDTETVRSFAAKVQIQESLRMLTLFTYGDISAVHPDALTPWKAENLWRLSMAAANHLDRNVDDERVHGMQVEAMGVPQALEGSPQAAGGKPAEAEVSAETRDKLARVVWLNRNHSTEVKQFLEGFPQRYISTRTAETLALHFQMFSKLAAGEGAEPLQMTFHHGAVSEVTLITQDRPGLFAGLAAALSGWGMDVVTADAFANSAGVVVDTFRFTDAFRTLELNPTERERFLESLREMIAGGLSGSASGSAAEKLLSGRRRARRKVPRVAVRTLVEFDNSASSQSTLLQVIARDAHGLLRTISATLSELKYNLEVALIDTEGDAAIDVFYITCHGAKLTPKQQAEARVALETAIATNAG